MFAKPRVLAILATLLLSMPLTRAGAQYSEDDSDPSFPERLEQFGRSLVGANRSTPKNTGRPAAQRPVRNPAPAQQARGPDYNAPFGDQSAAGRVAGVAPQQVGRPKAPPAQAQARPAYQRDTTPVPGSNAPPLGAGAPIARREAGPRVARSVAPEPAPEIAPRTAEAVAVRHTSPSVSIETVGPRTISVGKQATYKLILQNLGELPAKDVVVTVAVPEFAEVVDVKATGGATEPSAARDGLSWMVNSLAASGREELSLEIVPHKSQPFDLGVRFTQAALTTQTKVEVQEPKLALALDGGKDIAFGDRAIYKLMLSNPGTGDAENVVITLMPLSPSDGGPASSPIGVLRAGASRTIEVELIARQAGQLTIQAEATAAGDIKATLNESVTVRRAALAANVHGPKMQYANTPANYEVHVKNTGNAAAQNVRVVCRLPAQAEFTSASSSGRHVAERNVVEWTVAALAPDAEVTLSTKCVLHAAGANHVEVTALGDGDLQDTASAATQCQAVADLVLEIDDPSGPVPVGGEAMYKVHVRNRGSKGAEGIDTVVYFSNGIEPVSVEGGPHEIKPGMVVLKTIKSIEAGKEVVFKIKARADVAGNHRFRAEMNCQQLDTKLTAEEATLFYSETADETP